MGLGFFSWDGKSHKRPPLIRPLQIRYDIFNALRGRISLLILYSAWKLFPTHSEMYNISNRNYSAANLLWLMSRKGKTEKTEFMEKMINEPKTIPINPYTMLEIVDKTPYPWLILVYHSDTAKNYDGRLRNLSQLTRRRPLTKFGKFSR